MKSRCFRVFTPPALGGQTRAMRSAALCKQHTFALPWLALTLCSAVRPPPPPALDLDGACAGVKSSESWKDSKGSSHWSYRIKVQPWTVFGRVHVELHGYGMKVVDIYSGDVDEKAKSFWVSLHPEHSAGPDSTFQIEGEGEAYAEPTLTCEGLHQVALSRYAPSSRRSHPHITRASPRRPCTEPAPLALRTWPAPSVPVRSPSRARLGLARGSHSCTTLRHLTVPSLLAANGHLC